MVVRPCRNLLFLSQQFPALSRLLPPVMLFDRGCILADRPAVTLVCDYLRSVTGTTGDRDYAEQTTVPGNGAVRLRSVRVRLENGEVTHSADRHSSLAVEMQYDVLVPGYAFAPSYQFLNDQGTCLFFSMNPKLGTRSSQVGRYTSTCWIPGGLLAAGTVSATAMIGTLDPPGIHVFEQKAVAFEVTDERFGDKPESSYTGSYAGIVRPELDWTTDVAVLPLNESRQPEAQGELHT